MGRGIEPRAVTGGLQNACQRSCRRALTVRASNQDGGEAPLWMSKRHREHTHLVERKFVRRVRPELMAKLQQALDGSGIGHASISPWRGKGTEKNNGRPRMEFRLSIWRIKPLL